jgi:large subunit ribosomal protein L4
MPKAAKTTKTTKTKIVKTVKKSAAKTVLVFDMNGKEKPAIEMPEIFHQKPNQKLIAQAARVYESMLHQGTQSTKTRGEVNGTTKKIYRQKGTGRARHGSMKAPIFVGGGITFGPKPRNFKFDLPVKMRQLALSSLLSERFAEGKIIVVTGLKEATGKTSQIAKLLKNINLQNKKSLIILTPEMEKAIRATKNIKNVLLRPAQNLSFLDVLKTEMLVFAFETINKINQSGVKK